MARQSTNTAIGLSFPTTHPLFADIDATPDVHTADVLLCVDIDVPYIPGKNRPPRDATIITIDVDPLNPSIPLLGFPVDIPIQADSEVALDLLVTAVVQQGAANGERRARVEADIANRHAGWRRSAAAQADADPIAPEYLALTLGEVLDDSWTILEESVGFSPLVGRLIPRTEPETLYKSGGSSLGWSLPAALGAKLARPEKNIVTIVGDGTFVYACPTATLWASAVENAPFLTIIVNNKVHNATMNAHRQAYRGGYAGVIGTLPGIRIDPPPDYAALARASRAHGETVTNVVDLRPALERAMTAVRDGQSAVMDIHVNDSRPIP